MSACPKIPLPKPGDVWGVPGKPETRRFVHDTKPSEVCFSAICSFGFWYTIESWHAWVRETGAVDLLADREALVTEVGEMTRDRDYCCTELAKADAKIYQLAARVKELEQQLATADLGDSVALRSLLAAKTSAEAWKRECEKAQAVAAEAIRERDEMRAERDKCRTHADELYGDNERMQGCLTRYSRERDEAKASRDRLAGGLRKIESLWCHHASHLAQDILAKEGLPS